MVANVSRNAPDLSARQMAVLLTAYMSEDDQTVRGLAEQLAVAKPAITRAIDRLVEFGLVRRKTDPRDRRSIFVQRTVKGTVYLAELAEIIAEATEAKRREKAGKTAAKAQPKASSAAPKPAGAPRPKAAGPSVAKPARAPATSES